ncbi:LysR family transcriptional regulator [Paraburkholderia sp. MMS20-SJTR3]|uniref:LysR family transcriptional regulator n=1 Tax=Paraburkholderia sejongensis TaxID=2886946 RepID=A0ABS8JRR4_9BURK|nr:LysR substrate-binding domain-containing protein [Paraburkholderia sp. MMS20-SJTR3]MCC8392553.1 LysR family transcriptional regulator [Paraburkholderia sp. MMS20-SJTR3]
MRDIDLKTLRLFVAVCEFRNMGRAADEEHIEPSAISKRIGQLESDLGVPLLTRSRRGVQPTAAGLSLLEHARNVLFTMDRIASDVAAFGSGLKGSVSICATASAIAEVLLDDIAAFMREPDNQNIRVDVEERLSIDLVRQLREGAATVGVCWDGADLEGLQHLPYRQDRLALAVYPGHPLAKMKSLRFEQTLAFDHVGMPPSTAVHAMLQRAAAKAGRTVSYRVIVSNFDAAFRVVAARLGISVVPLEVGETYKRVFDVVTIPLTDPWARRRFVVCFRELEALQPAARRMVDHLASRASLAAG